MHGTVNCPTSHQRAQVSLLRPNPVYTGLGIIDKAKAVLTLYIMNVAPHNALCPPIL